MYVFIYRFRVFRIAVSVIIEVKFSKPGCRSVHITNQKLKDWIWSPCSRVQPVCLAAVWREMVVQALTDVRAALWFMVIELNVTLNSNKCFAAADYRLSMILIFYPFLFCRTVELCSSWNLNLHRNWKFRWFCKINVFC